MFSWNMLSTLSERFYQEYEELRHKDLSGLDIVYLFVDGVYESMKRYTEG